MRWLIGIVVVVALGFATYRTAIHRDHFHLDGWYVIELSCEGGFPPYERVTIRSDGTVERGEWTRNETPRTTKVAANPDDLAKLRTIVQTHEFAQLDEQIEGDPAPDACMTQLIVRTRSQLRKIRAYGRGHWPDVLNDAISAIRVIELPARAP